MTNAVPDEIFRVVGIGLHERSRVAMRLAFPDALLCGEGAGEQAAAHEFCRTEERAVVFVNIPATGVMAHQRTSLLFNQASVKLVALCEECTDAVYDEALRFEFSGAIPVESSVDIYRRVAAAVQRGELWVSREYLSRLTRRHLGSSARLALSERETAILALIAEDSSNQEIADRLFIARDTVRWHLKSLYAKLGISGRGSARRFARNILTDCLP